MQNTTSNLTAYSLFVDPYGKGFTKIKEACSSSTKKSQLYGNRVLHFILGCSHLVPIVNAIVTLVLHCMKKRTSKLEDASSHTLKQKVQYPATSTTQGSKAASPIKKEAVVPADTRHAKAKENKETPLHSSLQPAQITPADKKDSPATSLQISAEKKVSLASSLQPNKPILFKKPAPGKSSTSGTANLFNTTAKDVTKKIASEFLNFSDVESLSKANKELHTIITQPMLQKVFQREDENFFRAADLMFHDRTLIEHGIDIVFTIEEMAARHESLMNVLKQLDSRWINIQITFRENMTSVKMTLLMMALREIRSQERRLAVIKLLLEKGADPRIKACVYPRDPLVYVKDENERLLLMNAIKKLDAIDAAKAASTRTKQKTA